MSSIPLDYISNDFLRIGHISHVLPKSKELVLFVDAYDVLLLESAGDISNGLVERFLKIGDSKGQSWNGASIVFSAEKT